MVKMNFTRVNKRHVSIAAMALMALMAIDVMYQVGMHVRWRCWLPTSLAAQTPATQPAGTQPAGSQPASSQPAGTRPADTQPGGRPSTQKDGAKKPSKLVEISAVITKRNIFDKPKPTGHGLNLSGVLGRTALFDKGGRTIGIEEGQSAEGVKVVSIRDYEVTIEYKGNKETMHLSFGRGAGPGGPPMPQGPSMPPVQGERVIVAPNVSTQNIPAHSRIMRIREMRRANQGQGDRP